MDGLHVSILDSVAQLESGAERWNDLWRRSPSVRPTSRAEHLANWYRNFSPNRRFLAIALESQGQLYAALPLLQERSWPLSVWRTPGNAWTTSGELLLDQESDGERLCAYLIAALRKNLVGIATIDGANLTSPGMQEMRAALECAITPFGMAERFQVPAIALNDRWPRYLCSRSRNHRRQLRVICNRAERQGGVELQRFEHPLTDPVEPLLRECFELEAGGWKARTGTAILQHRNAWQYFREQAALLAAAGELAIATLRHRGTLIAFEYGWQSRGARTVLKIGYDSRRADLTPGQLLRYRLLEELFPDPSVQWLDFAGPRTRATGAWATHRYHVGRVLLGSGWLSGAALAGWRWKRAMRPTVPLAETERSLPFFHPQASLASNAELPVVQTT